MKLFFAVVFTALFLVILNPSPVTAQKQKEKGISIKEYEAFHKVLHPLQHDSLPKEDYESIRTKADELVSLGNAVVKLGVPYRTLEDNREPFERELESFSAHLKALAINAKDGTDRQVLETFNAVHDSFELLVSMLPKKE